MISSKLLERCQNLCELCSLVPDNINQIEGKVNEQTIVLLTQFVKKSL